MFRVSRANGVSSTILSKSAIIHDYFFMIRRNWINQVGIWG